MIHHCFEFTFSIVLWDELQNTTVLTSTRIPIRDLTGKIFSFAYANSVSLLSDYHQNTFVYQELFIYFAVY